MRSSPRLILAACLTAFAFSGLSCQKNRRRFEHRYLEKLASSDETVLKRAILELGRARSMASIPPLLEFAERDDEVGDLAAVALSMIGLESVSFYMSYGGEAGTPADVNDALRALAERASAARPRLLEIALKDPDDRFRAIAGDVLTSLGARPGMPGIIDALESGDHAVRLRSLRLIGRIGPPARSALPAVLAATAEDSDLPHPAASALAAVVSKNPAVLVSHLQDGNPNARLTVALTFERLGDLSEPHATELAERLFDEDIRVARAVAQTLALLGPRAKEAAPQIVRAIREARYEHPGSVINGFVWDPRVPLTTALGAMGPVTPEVIPALLEAVRATDSSDLQLRMAQDFRSGAVRALGDLEAWDPEIFGVLADSVKDR